MIQTKIGAHLPTFSLFLRYQQFAWNKLFTPHVRSYYTTATFYLQNFFKVMKSLQKCQVEPSIHNLLARIRKLTTKLQSKDYDQECTVLAQFLLGKVLARRVNNGKILKGIIVETEAYLGGDDKASHSFNGKLTERNKPMYAAPGTSYVYAVYGMYYCINVSARGAGAAVLLRALEPIENLDEMRSLRLTNRKSNAKSLKELDLCSGPSKLCISLNITKELNNLYMPDSDILWVEQSGPYSDSSLPIIKSARIGIEKCGTEWAIKKLRYYIFKCPHVSKRDKKCEKDFEMTLATSAIL